jgi:hypothetical protein
MIHALRDALYFLIGTFGGFVIGALAERLRRRREARQREWALMIIEEYQRARKRHMDRMMEESRGAFPREHALIGTEDPMGMRVQTGHATFDLPPFFFDVFQDPEENEERLREHIEEHGSEMPGDVKEHLVEELIKHAFPASIELQFGEQLRGLEPEDFREGV